MPHAVRRSPGTRGGCRDALLARGGTRHCRGLRIKRVPGNAHAAPRAPGGRALPTRPVSVGGVVAVVWLYVRRRALLPLPPRVLHPAHAGPRGNRAGVAVGDWGVCGVRGQGGRSHGWVACAVAFVAVTMVSPPLLEEQLYVVPSLLAMVAGMEFIWKHRETLLKSKVAKWWLLLGGLGLGVALVMVSLDKWLCAVAGANFAVLLWFFLGCNVAILSTHLFALEVVDNNMHFTDVKSQ